MTQLTVTALQLALLVLLWVLVLSVVASLRRDLFGGRGLPRQAAPVPGPAVPAAAPLATPPAPAAPPARQAAAPPPTPPVRREAPLPPRLLVVVEGPLAGTSLPLGTAPVVLGRGQDCTLVLPDDYASSHHARLVPGPGGRWEVEDLGSTNGTSAGDGAPTEPVVGSVPVGVGSRVRVGRTVVELRR